MMTIEFKDKQKSEMIDVFLRMNIEAERRKRIKKREEQIKYEYNLYHCFCLLFDLKIADLNSMKIFDTYCKIKDIKLL